MPLFIPDSTSVSFTKDAKTRGKSGQRYQKYSAAKTVGEALALGATSGDISWDYHRQILQIVGTIPEGLPQPDITKRQSAPTKKEGIEKSKESLGPTKAVSKPTLKMKFSQVAQKKMKMEKGTKDVATASLKLESLDTENSEEEKKEGETATVKNLAVKLFKGVKKLQLTKGKKATMSSCDGSTSQNLSQKAGCVKEKATSSSDASTGKESGEKHEKICSVSPSSAASSRPASSAAAEDGENISPENAGPPAKRAKPVKAKGSDHAGNSEGKESDESDKPKRKNHTKYWPETYAQIMTWQECTPIEYVPHAKKIGSKSYVRYEKYSQAKTVGEALAFGSKPADLCWDLEREFLKDKGELLREEPFDPYKIKEQGELSLTDEVLSKWYTRHVAYELGFDLKDLCLIPARRKADNLAAKLLEEIKRDGRKLTEAEVEQVLDQWGFKRNDARKNVLPDEKAFVFSDTLGMIQDYCGNQLVTGASKSFPNVTLLLNTWLSSHIPEELKGSFCWTSISVNFGYAAKLHRDNGNSGPSMITAFGAFSGGELNYYPDDDHSKPLNFLEEQGHKVVIDVGDGLALFDGRRGHSVNQFDGYRYSLVWFTASRWMDAPAEVNTMLTDMGTQIPSKHVMEKCQKLLQPPQKSSSEPTNEQYRFWNFNRDRKQPDRNSVTQQQTRFDLCTKMVNETKRHKAGNNFQTANCD